MTRSGGISNFAVSKKRPFRRTSRLLLLLSCLAPVSASVLVCAKCHLRRLGRLGDRSIGNVLSSTTMIISKTCVRSLGSGSILHKSSGRRVRVLGPSRRSSCQGCLTGARGRVRGFGAMSKIISMNVRQGAFAEPCSSGT